MDSILVQSHTREEMVDITAEVEAVLASKRESTTSSPETGATPPIEEESIETWAIRCRVFNALETRSQV